MKAGKFIKSSVYFMFHPWELRQIVQWFVWHEPVHTREPEKESETLQECFKYLDLTSRSFSAVIKELNPELLVPICLFYLVLRGLDTVEDDMTIPLEKKEPILRDFYKVLDKDGWTFTESGPNEKDRELLVHFDVVITEFQKIKPAYQKIISDIGKRMGNGMADYATGGEFANTIKEYELYCHYVAGLVGEGLTRLFVESGLANPALLKRPDLHESMGQFLQQTNIIRDIREDLDDKRRFWPKEVWSKYVDNFEDLFKKENEDIALRCSSEMILLALQKADDCLFYLAGIRDQSVFNFAAIPQTMAIATLELCFRNPAMFKRNIKITKGTACQLMWESSQNLQVLYGVFKRYARIIHKKNDPRDPNFLKISVACGRIEQFIESIFPTQQHDWIVGKGDSDGRPGETPEQVERRKKMEAESKWDVIYLSGAMALMMIFLFGIMLFIAWLFGARFDLAWSELRNFSFDPQAEPNIHQEL